MELKNVSREWTAQQIQEKLVDSVKKAVKWSEKHYDGYDGEVHAYSISLILLGVEQEDVENFIKEIREQELDRIECEKRELNQDGTLIGAE